MGTCKASALTKTRSPSPGSGVTVDEKAATAGGLKGKRKRTGRVHKVSPKKADTVN